MSGITWRPLIPGLGTPEPLQAETASQLDAILPVILQSSLGFDAAGDRTFKRKL